MTCNAKRNWVLAGAALALAAASSADAAVIAYDGFDYEVSPPDFSPTSTTDTGGLRGKDGGIGWAAAYTQQASRENARIVAGSLAYSDGDNALVTSGNRVQTTGNSRNFRDLASAVTLGPTQPEVWISYIADASTTGGGHAGIALFDGGTEIATLGKVGTNWSIFTPPSTTASSSTPATTEAFLVYQLVYGDGGTATINLWVNPDLGTTPATPADATATRSNFSFDNVRISSASGTTMEFDELRIGDTFRDVAPLVPEPASFALLAVGGSLLIGRRRGHA